MVNKSGISLFFHKRFWDIVSITIAIIVWQFIASVVVRNPFLLPGFVDVLWAFIVFPKSILFKDIIVSLMHFFTGLILGICVALPLGILMGWFKVTERLIDPIIGVIRPIPPIAWIPLAIIWLHLTHLAAGFVVFIGAVFPILINTYSGIRQVKRTLIEAAKTLGCLEDFNLVKSVAFPSASPSIASGIRIGMGVGWMSVVAAEMFGVSNNGLGYRLFQKFYFLHQMDNLIAYMIILGLISLLIDRAFRYFIENKLYVWAGKT